MNSPAQSIETIIEQAAETWMEEHTSLPMEDTSLPAEQVLTEQKEQEAVASLFVP